MCRLVELEVDRGATALVHGQALAVFRTRGDDRCTHSATTTRSPTRPASRAGIVGIRGDVPFVASPTHDMPSTCAPGGASTTSTCRCRSTTYASSKGSCWSDIAGSEPAAADRQAYG